MSIQTLRQESIRRGYKRLISLGALAAGGLKQYDRTHDDLKYAVKTYDTFNAMTIMNNSKANIAIDLDFNGQKRYIVLSSSMISVDSVMYKEFNVTNLSASDAIVDGEVYITVVFERPLARENVRY
jgi:hypothetical protein